MTAVVLLVLAGAIAGQVAAVLAVRPRQAPPVPSHAAGAGRPAQGPTGLLEG